ncbi:hypothetical protein TYRP_010022, partial [Tyrophagus putrescentiae]
IPFSLGISLWSKWPFRGLKHLNNAVFASVISDTGKFNQRRQLISKAAVNSQDFQFKTVFSNENGSLCLRQSKRGMAKGKDRKKEKKSDKPKVILDDEDMEKVIAFEDFKLEVQSIIDELKNDLKLNYNVRLNPRQIETIEINYDGVKVALADIVTVARKQQEIVINMAAAPNALKPAMTALMESGFNLNPQQDGTIIYIRLPKVTTEHRETLIKLVKTAGQKAKDKIKDRNFHKKFYHKGTDTKKLSQDLLSDVSANMNYFIKQQNSLIDEIIKQKTDSLINN